MARKHHKRIPLPDPMAIPIRQLYANFTINWDDLQRQIDRVNEMNRVRHANPITYRYGPGQYIRWTAHTQD
jgi:hypothetical protein